MIHRSVLSLVAVVAAGLVGLAGCGSAPAPAAPPPAEATADAGGHGGSRAVTGAARPTVSWSCGRCRPAWAWSSPTAPGT